MIKFTTQELEMESNLKQRIEFICEFCHTTPKIINGSIKRINNTNLNVSVKQSPSLNRRRSMRENDQERNGHMKKS